MSYFPASQSIKIKNSLKILIKFKEIQFILQCYLVIDFVKLLKK